MVAGTHLGSSPHPAQDSAFLVPAALYSCRQDDQWTMLVLTDMIEGITGYPAADFLGNTRRSFESIIHPGDRAMVRAEVAAALQLGRPFDVQYRIHHRDGGVRWVQEQGHCTHRDHDGIGILAGVILDITGRVEARHRRERAKDASARRQQSAVLSLATSGAVSSGDFTEAASLATRLVADAAGVSRVGIWLYENDGRLELVDCFERDERSHSRGAYLNLREFPLYFEALLTGRFISAEDVYTDARTQELSGYLRPHQITALLDAPLRLGGELVGVLCLEHRGGEREWTTDETNFASEIADQLAHALANREREKARGEQLRLQEQLFQAQKMEAVGRLAGGVAHDFNNLLTVILGHAELLRDQLDAPLRSDIEQVLEAGQRAAELTAQLLTFSRREELQVENVDLRAVLLGTERLLEHLLGDVQLRVYLEDGPLRAEATEGLIQQILVNLAVNARDAMGGEGVLTIEAGVVQRDKEPVPPGSYARIRVLDSGPGVPLAIADKIFEPFFTTKGRGDGTGLGLATVYAIAQRCQGTVELVPTPKGACFDVFLPLAEQSKPPARRPATVVDKFGQGRRVLVVEDNPAVLRLTQRLLEEFGFEVDGADGVVKAIAHLESAVYDLVLSDVVMPAGGGVAVLSWLRAHENAPPVLLMSGYLDEHTERQVNDVPRLGKPFTSLDLGRMVQGILDSKG